RRGSPLKMRRCRGTPVRGTRGGANAPGHATPGRAAVARRAVRLTMAPRDPEQVRRESDRMRHDRVGSPPGGAALPETGQQGPEPGSGPGAARALAGRNVWDWPVLALVFALAAGFQLGSGAYDADFCGYPDEAPHFVTSLLFSEYLGSPFSDPFAFATR